MRARLPLLLALLLLLGFAGCGGGGDGSPLGATTTDTGTPVLSGTLIGAANVIPASAPVVVAVNTDFEGDQADKVNELLQKFPGREGLFAQITKSLGEDKITFEDLKAALGPETDVVLLDVEASAGSQSQDQTQNAIVLTQPKDEAKLQALLQKGDDPSVSAKVGDWTAIANTQALLDRFQAAGPKLADSQAFKDALSGLPADRLATVYVAGSALTKAVADDNAQASKLLEGLEWLAASASAADKGIALDFRARGAGVKETDFAPALESIPGGALAAMVFKGGDLLFTNLRDLQQVKELEQQTGVSVGQIEELFAGETALFVRTGSPLPEITAVLTPANAGSALTTLDTLVSKLSQTPPTTEELPGIGTVKKLAIPNQPVAIYYGTVNDKVVVTTAPTGFTAVKEPTTKLTDDPVFEAVKDEAGLPEENSGFVYLNLKDTLPLLQTLAQAANQTIPPEVTQNLAPLRALLIYATTDGNTLSARGFLHIE